MHFAKAWRKQTDYEPLFASQANLPATVMSHDLPSVKILPEFTGYFWRAILYISFNIHFVQYTHVLLRFVSIRHQAMS